MAAVPTPWNVSTNNVDYPYQVGLLANTSSAGSSRKRWLLASDCAERPDVGRVSSATALCKSDVGEGA